MATKFGSYSEDSEDSEDSEKFYRIQNILEGESELDIIFNVDCIKRWMNKNMRVFK